MIKNIDDLIVKLMIFDPSVQKKNNTKMNKFCFNEFVHFCVFHMCVKNHQSFYKIMNI